MKSNGNQELVVENQGENTTPHSPLPTSYKPWTIARLENGKRVISKWRFELRTDAEKLKAALEKNHPTQQWEVVRVRRKPG